MLGIYDAIATDATTLACADFLHAVGGGKIFRTNPYASGPEPQEGVVRVNGRADTGVGVWRAIWADFMGKGLRERKLRAKLDPFVLKGGLERLEEAVDMVRKGVSATKVVVEVIGD